MSAGLGRLVRVQPREVWANEAAHFTPWLAEPENVALLGETLGMDLEVEAVERAVGPFRADILCKDAGTDHLVLIENQLEASDHRHLGQILTYASGLDAFTIVWIATTIRDEHRATLDWLNEITASEVRFFALEVELWRIGASPPAPKFNVVCRPNDWTRSVKRGAAEVEDADPNGHRAEDAALWTALDARLDERDGPVVVPRQLSRSNWRNYRLGRINFGLSATVLRSRRLICAELWINAKQPEIDAAQVARWFDALHQDREAFDHAFGEPLHWQRLDHQVGCRIATQRPLLDLTDAEKLADVADWLADRLTRLHTTFADAVRHLPAAPASAADEGPPQEPPGTPPH